MSTILFKDVFRFLNDLQKNNHRDWMLEHKKTYQENEKRLKVFYQQVKERLNLTDEIEGVKIFRINRDIRFSKDKTPYKVHRSVVFTRSGTHRRGSYYLHLEPGNSMIAGGFFSPEKDDLHRIRKEFEVDSCEIRSILNNTEFKKIFGGFNNEYRLKTAPKGFDKNDSNIDLIRLKAFYVTHPLGDTAVFRGDFQDKIIDYYQLLLPFFDYMSEVLTTDLNGRSII